MYLQLRKNSSAFLAMILLTLSVARVTAQTTSFTYQGRLTDGGTAANGLYDLQFGLWDSLSSGSQIGSTQTLSNVLVSAGVFNVNLDFGASSFNGANRFLEINARLSGSGSFTLLTPRQQVTSTPYAIRSTSASSADTATTATSAANATQLGGIAAGQYVQTNDSRLSDARAPTAGSNNYIQNTSSPQSGNFNISGTGTVGGTMTANGNVGIGTSSPLRTIQIGPGFDAAFTVSPSDVSPNAGFIRFGDSSGWKLHFARSRESSGGSLNTGTSGLLMTIQDNGNIGVGTASPRAKLDVRGDAVQSLSSNGLVKAMLLVNGDGTINLCYNSQLTGSATTTLPCGFSSSRTSQGGYVITFPFQVNTRFFSATMGDIQTPGAMQVGPLNNGTQVFVVTNGGASDNRFYLIVY